MRSVDHVKDIISAQQRYASAQCVVEPVQIAELVDEALRLNGPALMRLGVHVEKACQPTPTWDLDRLRIQPILVNLIANAVQALERAGPALRLLTLGVELTEDRRLRVWVADNGVGIAGENLTRVFAHGFTTRENWHGFGLHGASIADREMGATLFACSAGHGEGARFTFDLQVETAAEYS